jgi:succinate dehydrogenase / fumarate reductase, cytochrome b subunit
MAQTVSRYGRVEPIRPRSRVKLPFPLNLYQTAVGKKWVMAVTGIMLLGFVIVHLAGNLKIYMGAEEINEYGESLRNLGGHLVPRTHLLWVLRLGLAAAFFLHIHSAWGVTRMSRAANTGYEGGRDYIAANFASRTMRWTGIIVALYVLFHLADLTWGWWLGDDFIRGDVYYNLTQSLSSAPVALIYIVANTALAIHIFHGAWSMFQSLGINNPKYNPVRRMVATGIALFVLVGNLSFPILVQAGVLENDGPTPHEEAAP